MSDKLPAKRNLFKLGLKRSYFVFLFRIKFSEAVVIRLLFNHNALQAATEILSINYSDSKNLFNSSLVFPSFT